MGRGIGFKQVHRSAVVVAGPQRTKNALPNHSSDKLSATVASRPVRIALPLTCSQRAGFQLTRATTALSELKSRQPAHSPILHRDDILHRSDPAIDFHSLITPPNVA